MGHFNRLKKRSAEQAKDSSSWSIDKAVIETGRMVYEWRLAKGLSQQELAEAIGTKQESISRIERGLSKEGPRLKTLAAIADACGQRLIISGGSNEQVSAADQRSADSAWGVCSERPRTAGSAASTTRLQAKSGGGKIDIELVDFESVSNYLKKLLEVVAAQADNPLAAKAKRAVAQQVAKKVASRRAEKLHLTAISKEAGSYVMHGVELEKQAKRLGKNPKVRLNLLELLSVENKTQQTK